MAAKEANIRLKCNKVIEWGKWDSISRALKYMKYENMKLLIIVGAGTFSL